MQIEQTECSIAVERDTPSLSGSVTRLSKTVQKLDVSRSCRQKHEFIFFTLSVLSDFCPRLRRLG